MNKLRLATVLMTAFLNVGCRDTPSGYEPASSISKGGLARNPGKMRAIDGQEIRLWGFVDHGNLYGNDGAKAILDEWWSGYGPNAATWSFNLKADKDDKTGHSFRVTVPNDPGRDAILEAFVADARTRKPTKVYVKGRIFAFAMPTNAATLTGLSMTLECSRDIAFSMPAN